MGKFNVGVVVGVGILSVIKDWKENYFILSFLF